MRLRGVMHYVPHFIQALAHALVAFSKIQVGAFLGLFYVVYAYGQFSIMAHFMIASSF